MVDNTEQRLVSRGTCVQTGNGSKLPGFPQPRHEVAFHNQHNSYWSRLLQHMQDMSLAHLHLNGSTTRDHLCMLEGTPHDHDGIMEGPVSLVNELCTQTQGDNKR
jgi:hypothetical protein